MNNTLSNLQILCPNCHSQTDNFRGRNIGKNKNNVTDTDLINALNECDSVRQALVRVGLTCSGANYLRANELIIQNQIAKYLRAPDLETI